MWSRVLREAAPQRERLIPPRLILSPRGDPEPQGAEDRPEEKARLMVEQAQREADLIRQKAEEERQLILARAKEEGWREGFDQGLLEGKGEAEKIREEAEKLRQEARQVLAEARKAFQETILKAEEEIISLVETIAARIIDLELQSNREVLVKIARQAIRQVAEGEQYVLYVAPGDEGFIRQHHEELLQEMPAGSRLLILSDPSLEKGGCRVETENGFVDASIDAQLEELKRILRGK